MIRFFYIIVFVFIANTLSITNVSAVESNLEIKILPKDCVFEVVDSGSQQILYLTPEECGLVFEEEASNPTPISLVPEIRYNVPIQIPSVDLDNNGIGIDGNTIIINGKSDANVAVGIYVDGLLVGSVMSNHSGQWTFTYTSETSAVNLQFQACTQTLCSALSKNYLVYVDFIQDGCSNETNPVGLREYMFRGIKANEAFFVEIVNGIPLANVYQTKGDGGGRVLGIVVDNRVRLEYSEPGQYEGEIEYIYQDCLKRFRYTAFVEDNLYSDQDMIAIIFVLTILNIVLVFLVTYKNVFRLFRKLKLKMQKKFIE